MDMIKLLVATEEIISKISCDRWQFHCSHVQKLELKYYDKNGIIEDICESLKITFTDSEENDKDCDSEATRSPEDEEE